MTGFSSQFSVLSAQCSVSRLRWLHVSVILLGLLFLASVCSAEILQVEINDAIQPVTAEYVGRALEAAAANHDDAVLIEINTPGGLVDSTREIIEKIVASPVPVIVYVTPSGSRAASAGFFILESADVAAMAPGTNTGAAHPVILGGKMDDVMKQKMENDAAGVDALGCQPSAAAMSKSQKALCGSRSHSPIRRRSTRS